MIKILFSIMLMLAACQVQGQTLKVGTAPINPPNTFLADNGTIIGFDIDFFNAVTKIGGIQYEWVQASWEDMFAEVLNSTLDLAVSAITINDAREEIYDFSVPYFVATFLILAPEGTDITNAQDLALLNKTVAVINGTTGQTTVEAIFGGESPNIIPFLTTDEAFQALSNGSVDAFVTDSGVIEYLAKNNPGFVTISDPTFAKQLYGFMFPKGSSLVAEFNSAITTVLQNGEYASIYTTWFGSTPDVDLLLAAGEDENPYDALNEEAVFGEEGYYIEEEEGVIPELGEMSLLL